MKTIPVILTASAKKEIIHTFERKKIPEGFGLRLAVKGGGCSGISFIIGFDQQKVGDEVFSEDGIPIFIEKKHFLHLAGMQVDFVEDHTERGFLFLPVSPSTLP